METVAVAGQMPRRLPLFATAARGTEELLADELQGARSGAGPRGSRRGPLPGQPPRGPPHRGLWSRIAMRLL